MNNTSNITKRNQKSFENSCEESSIIGSDPPPPSTPPKREDEYTTDMVLVTTHIPLYEGYKDQK